MQASKKQLKQNLALFLFSSVVTVYHPAMAETDLSAQEKFLKARVASHQPKTEHAAHEAHLDKSQEFHGVFYGYVPCNDCPGIKTTLSLKQHNNYLLVTQPARESSREFYEKGKYSWNEEKHTVTLTPRKAGETRHYLIEDEETLVQLNVDGTRMVSEQSDRYVLRRSDTVKSREVHFH
jgi:uncharacterized lipoprotein NlpE involved in copper resistance